MRSRACLAVVAPALALLAACSGGSDGPAHPAAPAPTARAWDSAYVTVLHGLDGSFRSSVVGTPCTEPIRKPCVVGGAQIRDVGVFKLAPQTARYEHYAFSLTADVSEARGYRALAFQSGDSYVSAMGRGGCWARTVNARVPFGSGWLAMPPAFKVLLNADAENDPLVSKKALRLNGVADAEVVLEYLGLGDLYFDAGGGTWTYTRVPIELRLGADGLPKGFSVEGSQVAEALVGPSPSSSPNAPAAFRSRDVDRHFAAEVWHRLEPMRGRLDLFDLGKKQTIKPPPKRLLIGHRAMGDDPCPARG